MRSAKFTVAVDEINVGKLSVEKRIQVEFNLTYFNLSYL